MNRTQSQFARLLELDRRIRAGRYPNCLTFAKEWEVSQKTVQRDVDYLKYQLGAPLKYDREKKGFCYTNQTWFLPSLSLSEGDLFALLVASKALEQYRGTPVAKELERVFAKLTGMLPDKLSLRPELIFSRFSFTAPPAKPVDEKIWTCVVRGLLTQTKLKISYRSMEATAEKDRVLSPYHVANLQGEWYVFGHSDIDGEIRQFALPRIQKAKLTDQHFDMPDDFDPDKMMANTFGRFVIGEKAHAVRLLFDAEVAPWVLERQWHPKQRTTTHTDGKVELSFPATGLFEVFRWVLAWGHLVRVLAPELLQCMITDEVRCMAGQKP
ncbi:MAG: WYL domain-containing protein [Kiritimatiellaeota bacterium]|nr:WYL domain-containing protein [Kiritimatiellota bacterium]